MKAHFFLVLVGVLGLAGCVQNPADDPRYDTDNILLHKDEWRYAYIPYDIARKCQWNDVPLAMYQHLTENGITSVDDIVALRAAFDRINPSYNGFMPEGEQLAGLKKIYAAIKAGDFTMQDLSQFLAKGYEFDTAGKENAFGGSWFSSLSHPDTLINDVERVRNGSTTADAIIQGYIDYARRDDEAYRAKIHKQGGLLLDEVPKSWWDYGSFRCGNSGCHSTTKITKQYMRDIDQAKAEEKKQDFVAGEVGYKQLGMSPHLAYEAMWAMQNRPESDCAQQVRMVSTYERELATGRWNDDGLTYPADSNRSDLEGQELDAIATLERSGVCERKNVLKPIPKPELYVYDPKKDFGLRVRQFYNQHPQEGHDLLSKAGIKENIIERIRLTFRRNESTHGMPACAWDAAVYIDNVRHGFTKGDEKYGDHPTNNTAIGDINKGEDCDPDDHV